MRNLINLAVNAGNRGNSAKILFTSSVGVANKIGPDVPRITEAPITDFAVAGSGYGESKLVAEKLLLEAAVRGGVDIVICRVGQIAGPVGQEHRGGLWNRKEWFPSVSCPPQMITSVTLCPFLTLVADHRCVSIPRPSPQILGPE